eukprot:1517410-Rhodomonas_salina.1
MAGTSLPNPTRWYKFDATNPLADSGTEGKDLYHGGSADSVDVKFLCPSGGCVDFQADAPYLALDAMQTSSSRWTLSFYLMISEYTNSARQLLCLSQDECITMSSSKWGFKGGGDLNIWDQSSLTPVGEWVHLLFVWNKTAVDAHVVQVYKDGSYYSNWTFPDDSFWIAMDDSEWWLGHMQSNSEEFIGEMAVFRVFDSVAFDSAQALQEYALVAASSTSPNLRLQPSNLPTSGGLWITAEILVSAVAQSTVLRLGLSACAQSKWVSDSTLSCLISSGIGGSVSLTITHAMNIGTSSYAASYDKPAMFQVAAQNFLIPPAVLTVSGAHFGETSFSVGTGTGSTRTVRSAWSSSSSLSCRAGAGLGRSLTTGVSVGAAVGTFTQAVSFDSGNGVRIHVMNLAAGRSVPWTGIAFGKWDLSLRSRQGNTGCERTDWVSDTAASSKGAVSLGSSLMAVISQTAKPGTVTQVVTFDAGYLRSLDVADSADPTWIIGTDMGTAQCTVWLMLGHSSCESTPWVSQTSVACIKASGAGGSLWSVLTASSQTGTLTEAATYEKPWLCEQTNHDGKGLESITVTGTYPRSSGRSITARIAETQCRSTRWVSDSSVSCKVLSELTGSRRAVVTVGTWAGTLSEAGTYDLGSITGVELVNQQTAGHNSMTVHGVGLGPMEYSLVRPVGLVSGGTGCEGTGWVSESSVTCK